MEEVDWRRYDGLDGDPGLARVRTGPGLRLYRVTSLRSVGRVSAVEPVFGPVVRVTDTPQPGGVTWSRSGQPGWLRGWQRLPVTADGRLLIPGGRGPVWYWPALVALTADLLLAIAAILSTRSLYRT